MKLSCADGLRRARLKAFRLASTSGPLRQSSWIKPTTSYADQKQAQRAKSLTCMQLPPQWIITTHCHPPGLLSRCPWWSRSLAALHLHSAGVSCSPGDGLCGPASTLQQNIKHHHISLWCLSEQWNNDIQRHDCSVDEESYCYFN